MTELSVYCVLSVIVNRNRIPWSGILVETRRLCYSYLMTNLISTDVGQRPKVGVAVVVMNDKRQLLLGLRTGNLAKGLWACPGGHLEHGEDLFECAQRELYEETGLQAGSLEAVGFSSNLYENNKHFVSLFIIARDITGDVQNPEPDKCQGWEWCDWDNLPEPLMPSLRFFVDQYNVDLGTSLPHRRFSHV